MINGIYGYFDTKNNSFVYIGLDTNVEVNRRNYEHHAPSKYDDQPINRILQNNPSRYIYQILVWDVEDLKTLNALEVQYIRQLNTYHYDNPHGFNFTRGGDGVFGWKHTKETRRKMSKKRKGKYIGENHPMYGKEHSEKSKYLQSVNISKANNTTGFYRVSIHNNRRNKQGFCYVYSYTQDGKRKQISSVDLDKLEQKVKNKGLEWIKFEKED